MHDHRSLNSVIDEYLERGPPSTFNLSPPTAIAVNDSEMGELLSSDILDYEKYGTISGTKTNALVLRK